MSTLIKCIFIVICCLISDPRQACPAAFITGSGCSVSIPGYLAELAMVYEKESGVRVAVRGGGSLQGLHDLANNRVDFAASCKSKSPDDPEDLDFTTVAWDALVFVVHKSNPVNTITPEQVRDIYDGRITNWRQLGGPDLPFKSFIATKMGGVGESLSQMVLKGKSVTKQNNSILLSSSVAIWEQLVEKTPGGFASSGFSSARKRNVKMLKVNGVSPTKVNISTDKYPLRRPLYIVMKKNTRPEARRFLDYVLSKKGQGLISSYGMVSLSEAR
ncbi:MAG: phosphate ABC transporter substrate-binding protein [Nitrospirae bacterium]|nr:phosphate ABC transporter substrate-binding protein [Nitrospirota bacterium]